MKAVTKDDEVRIAEYRKTLGKYAKPSVTADIIAVRPAYGELGENQWRENPKCVPGLFPMHSFPSTNAARVVT